MRDTRRKQKSELRSFGRSNPFDKLHIMNAVALLDANNFYCSCERLFDATLHGKPIIVLSNNDGCVVARSNEAKRLGIKMGVPLFTICDLIETHGVRVYSSNYTLYGDISARLMTLLAQFTAELEIYSIDEAFLSLNGIPTSKLEAYGRDIKRKVEKWIGIPVSIGIARTKTLAKIANFHAKHSPKAAAVVNLTDSPHIDVALKRIAVGDVWGIGSSYTRLLHSQGIGTALDLRDTDADWVRRNMSIVGLRIVKELRGEACLPLESAPRPRHSITVSRTFAKPVATLAEVQEAVRFYVARAGEKLRQAKLATGVLTVFLMTDRFSDEPQYSNASTIEMADSTHATCELLRHARTGVARIFRDGYKYRRAGVMLGDLQPSDKLTLRLFEAERWQRTQKLTQTIDLINRRWGRDAVHYGLTKHAGQSWRTRLGHRSPGYTTDWRELLTVKS